MITVRVKRAPEKNCSQLNFVIFIYNFTCKSEHLLKIFKFYTNIQNVCVPVCKPVSAAACDPNELITSSVFVTTRRSPSCEFRTMTSCELKKNVLKNYFNEQKNKKN